MLMRTGIRIPTRMRSPRRLSRFSGLRRQLHGDVYAVFLTDVPRNASVPLGAPVGTKLHSVRVKQPFV